MFKNRSEPTDPHFKTLRRVVWFRSISAVVIFVCLYLLLVTVIAPAWSLAIINALTGPLGSQGAVFATVAIFSALPATVAVGVFTAVDRYLCAKEGGEFETRCRKCRYILRGITEPRCPECGEKI